MALSRGVSSAMSQPNDSAEMESQSQPASQSRSQCQEISEPGKVGAIVKRSVDQRQRASQRRSQ
eukprot:366529-Chlamydomonas_euryale.AAC.6